MEDKKEIFKQIRNIILRYSKGSEWSEADKLAVEGLVSDMINFEFPMCKVPAEFMLSHPTEFLQFAEESIRNEALGLAFVDKHWIKTYPWDFVNLSKIAIRENLGMEVFTKRRIREVFDAQNSETAQYIQEINEFSNSIKKDNQK